MGLGFINTGLLLTAYSHSLLTLAFNIGGTLSGIDALTSAIVLAIFGKLCLRNGILLRARGV